MTSAQPYPAVGSKPWISGEFSVITEINSLLKNLPDAINAALEETRAAEQSHLENAMSNHPDWRSLTNKASVKWTNEGLSYRVDGEDASNLEYGNPHKGITTTGLIRSTVYNRRQTLDNDFLSRITKGLQ